MAETERIDKPLFFVVVLCVFVRIGGERWWFGLLDHSRNFGSAREAGEVLS